MPLAQIAHIPADDDKLLWWAFYHDQQHQQIVAALNKKFGLKLNPYILYPIPAFDMQGWLARHAQAHNDMNAALNFNGADLSSVDFKDKTQREAFEWLNLQEHQNAASALGLA